MELLIRSLGNQKGNQTGVVLTAVIAHAINPQQKETYEEQLIDYAKHTLYPHDPVNIFREESLDIASIVVIKDINNLNSQNLTI
jgi:hypothetical protein